MVRVDLIKGSIAKSLFFFAIPIFISSIFQQLYNTVDTMVVGNFLGDASLAAIGASSSVYDLMVGFALGIGNGLSMVTARSYGSNDKELLKRSVAASVVIGVFITAMITIVSQIFLHPLLKVLHTPAAILEESYSYISTLTLFVGVMFAYNLCAGLLKAVGNSLTPLIFLIISSVFNIVLDLLFITKLGMGIQGAAVATVIAQAASVVLCVIYLFRKCRFLLPEKRHFAYEKTLYTELLGQGFSMGLMGSIVSAGSVIMQTGINDLGYLVIAGHTAARKLRSFCQMPVTTMALSLSTFVSQNRGANKGYRIRTAARYSIVLSVFWGAVITAILMLYSGPLVKILSGSGETVVLESGAKYLLWNAPFLAILGILLSLRYSLQGLGSKLLPLVSSLIELAGKIIFVLFFIPEFGYNGVILCEPVIWCFMCAQLLHSFYTNPYMKESRTKVRAVAKEC